MFWRFQVIFFLSLVCLCKCERVACDKTTACEPWDIVQGPFCSRGNRMNLKFSLDIAPENGYVRYDQFNTEVTYASCVTVDELSAVNLTNAGRFVGTVLTNTSAIRNTTNTNTTEPVKFTSQLKESWLSAYGFGGNDNIAFPNKANSTGAIMIFTNDTSICEEGKLPFVNFVILKVSFLKGRFNYVAENNQPTGVGFDSTCSGGKCTFDSGLKCIGDFGKENCARCYTADELNNVGIQVWLSYGGTDRTGKDLLSHTTNPLNFRRYAGSSAYSQVANSVEEATNGKLSHEDPLTP